jgi:hypothetical protein
MVWDATSPAGTDLLSQGDDVIRELKTDIASALSTEGIFPGSDTSDPVFKWTGKRGNTISRPSPPTTGEIYFNTELFQMEYYSGTTWVAYDLVPSLGIITAKINDLAVTEGKIGALAVTEGKIGALAVTEGKIGSLAVTENKLGAGAVTNTKLGAGAVTDAKVTDVAFGKITGTVTPSDGTVTNAKLGAGAVTDDKVTDVAFGKITGTVTPSNGTVTNAKLGAGAVTDAKVTDVAVGKITGTLGVANGGTNLTTNFMRVVGYTGSGGDNHVVAHGLGVTPTFVMAIKLVNENLMPPVIRAVGMAANYSRNTHGDGGFDMIKSMDATNVTLGTSTECNQNGLDYVLICLIGQ